MRTPRYDYVVPPKQPALRVAGLWGSGWLTRFALSVFVTGLLVLFGAVADTKWGFRPTASVGPYSFSFALGAPATPQSWDYEGQGGWDVIVHARSQGASQDIGGLNTVHSGANCSGFPGYHFVNQAPDSVFLCNNHMMTALNEGGYGATYLTAPVMVDFSQGAVIKWDQSLFRMSDRDWTDLWITPFNENLALPLESDLQVDLNGPPQDAIHVMLNQFNQQTNFRAETYNGFAQHGLNADWWDTAEALLAAKGLALDPKGRYRIQVTLSSNHINVALMNYDGHGSSFTFVDSAMSVPFTQGVVQLGTHSYTPDKAAGCGPPPEQKANPQPQFGSGSCYPDTWHWSNFSIDNAIGFTIDPAGADHSFVGAGTGQTLNFARPTQQGSFLRFAGQSNGNAISVSFDGGHNWRAATPANESRHPGAYGGWDSFWMPMPTGVSSVMFSGSNPCCSLQWSVRDVSAWSQGFVGPPPNSATSTPGGGGQPSSKPSSNPTPTSRPTPPPGTGSRVPGGINGEPSMRPWRYMGANPDGWWCVPPNCFQNANPMTTINTEMGLVQRLGAKTLRLEFPWALIEPGNGVYDWSRADAIVAAARADNVTLQPVLVYTPSWINSDPTQAPTPAQFQTFVNTIVNRYKGSVHYWEMWNEPDHPHYWNAGEGAYVQDIVIPGYAGAKAADPTAQVILAGPSGWNGAWFNGIFTNGGGSSFDIVAYHDYGGTPQNTAFTVKAAEAAHGLNKPIWLGEYGVQETSASDTQQQALMTAVLTSSAPLAMAQWYNLRDDFSMTCCPPTVAVTGSWGLVMHDDATMKNGFATMQALLSGTSGPGPTANPSPSGGDTQPTPRPEGTPTVAPTANVTPRGDATPTPRR